MKHVVTLTGDEIEQILIEWVQTRLERQINDILLEIRPEYSTQDEELDSWKLAEVELTVETDG